MYVYIHIHVCTYMSACAYIVFSLHLPQVPYIYTCTLCHIDMYVCICIYECIYISACAYIVFSLHLPQVSYIYTCTLCHIDMYVYICIYVCIYIRACAYIARFLQVPYGLPATNPTSRGTYDGYMRTQYICAHTCARTAYSHSAHT